MLRSVGVLVVLLLSAASAQSAPRRVLLLHSYEPQFAPYDAFAIGFRTDLSQQATEPVQFFDISLQPARSQGPFQPGPLIDYLNVMFGTQPPDLVVPIGGPAVQFVQEHRRQLFSATPVLLAAVDHRLVRNDLLTDQDGVIAVADDPAEMVRSILRLLPKTTNLLVILGSSPHERFWRRELERDLQLFGGRLKVNWTDALGFGELRARVATLPEHSAILFVLWSIDAKGIPQAEERTLPDLQAIGSSPIFGFFSSQLGRGIVGGPVMDVEALSRRAASAALRILQGEQPGSLRPPAQHTGPPMFDARELQRWGINETVLPSGSVVRFREPGLWERHRWLIVAGISVVLVEGVLIAALIGSRRERQHAEAALARLSRTLMQAQEEERAWVARELHEDLCQRMVALTVQLQLVAAQVSPASASQVEQISADVQNLVQAAQALSRRLHTSTLELLGLEKTVAAFCGELALQHDVEIDVDCDGRLDNVPGDVALALFRVLQEALHNSLAHSGSHHFVVRLFGGSREIELQVSDDGQGFDVQAAMRSHGLGLVAMQQRLSLVGGRVTFDSRQGIGTTVRASVPRDVEDGDTEAVHAHSHSA